ncbi:uncharacterized protein N7483_007451 [Penicillium malachiteum]|uniref:uncharacterized protein n=1 Tax=Penicillium malachiteum TaxID=1324776 RepID=UPI002548DBF7|nr:uncharacterized protein N7483_007451 [Penicillium malachiteum]KAJ5726094.1 hypothetical protein N7483_007451 [Penicillium malachiteum]
MLVVFTPFLALRQALFHLEVFQLPRVMSNQASQARGGYGTFVSSNQARDPFLSGEEARIRGIQVIQWIENPSADNPPCPVSMNTLTYQQVQDESDGDMFRMINFMPGIRPDALIFPVGVEAPRNYIQRYVGFGDNTKYILFFAPGVIGLYDIVHEMGSPNPHPTDVALTLYSEEFGALDTLRCVFVYGVINTQTVAFLNRHIEARSIAQFGSPDMLEHYAYMYGTPEREGLVGVRIPRTVGYLVLGAFPRGSRRIARIEAYASPGPSYDIRFDIEPIQ